MDLRGNRGREAFSNQNSEKSLENCFRQNLALGKPKRVLVSMAIGAGWEPDKAREIMNRADGSERKKRAIAWGTIGYYLLLLLIISSFTLFYFTDSPTAVVQLPIRQIPIIDVGTPALPTGAVTTDSPKLIEKIGTDKAITSETIATKEDYIIREEKYVRGSGGSGSGSSSGSSRGSSSGSSNLITGDATGTFDSFGGGSSGSSSSTSHDLLEDSDDTFEMQSFACDEGDLDTTCVISTLQTISDSIISLHNLTITESGGLEFASTITNLTINATGNVTIIGTISGVGNGFKGGAAYNNGFGPGYGEYRLYYGGGGGGYGGYGGGSGRSGGSIQWGERYGNNLIPTLPGSGGGGGMHSAGGAGGGFLKILGDVLELGGEINLDGVNGGTVSGSGDRRCGGGGSGGGIFLNASKIQGSGIIQARGGIGGACYSSTNGDSGAGGGGGRISIWFNEDLFTGTVNVSGGDGGDGNGYDGKPGMDGSLIFYRKDRDELIIKDRFRFENFTYNFSTIIFDEYSYVIVDDWNSTIYAENITINATAIINGSLLGSKGGGAGQNGGGEGAGLYQLYVGGGGAGYGGDGGAGGVSTSTRGYAYGDPLLPFSPGSGGGGGNVAGAAGGSEIRLHSTNNLILDGQILMDGGIGASAGNGHYRCGGGGSGGAVFINTSIFSGEGTISANGGAGGNCLGYGDSSGGGGGAGGRVALEFSQFLFSGIISVNGGALGDGGKFDGTAGSDGTIRNRTRILQPNDPMTAGFNINSTLSGDYINRGDVYGENQTLIFESDTFGRRFGLHVYTGNAVDFSSLVIDASDTKTAINASGIDGSAEMYHTLYVPNANAGAGIFVCPDAVSVSQISGSCSGVLEFKGPYPQAQFVGDDRVTVYIDGPDYKVTNLSGTGIGTSPIANLSIYDDTDLEMGWLTRYVNNQTYFYANWTNKTSGANINHTIALGMECLLDFDDTSTINMTLNTSNGLYFYNRTFLSAGLFDWNVTCNGTTGGYDIVFASDTVNISSIPPKLSDTTFSSVLAANIIIGHEGYYNWTTNTAGNDLSSGANITELNFTTNASTSRWQGYYGEIVSQLAIGVDSFTFFNWNSTGAGQDDIVNMIFTSVNENFPFVDATNISDATLVDGAYSFDSSAVDSINETYKYGLDVGGSHTRALDYPNVNYVNGVFGDGTVESVSGSPLNYSWGAKVIANDPDFLGATSDYMLLVPVNQTTVGEQISREVIYYFFMELN